MISNSRFDKDLILLGMIADKEGSKSLLQIQIRDPAGNMTEGFRPSVRRSEQNLTRMAESATNGVSDVDVDGYNDYRGVPVVGAWSWLPDYGFGVTTEQDVAEAYRPLTILKRAFWGLLVLMATSVAIFVFSIMVSRLQRKAREAAIEAKQLGQYQLEDKLGEGGMGVVYRGKHSMLRRPTAIKLINADKVTERSIQNFEREVQPEGVFYYAMEYLDGIELSDLVEEYGPLDPARIIYIVTQICDSLYEAHTHGLVHSKRLAGTPLYMSPESIQAPTSVNACSDIYAVGGVAYYLATGRPMFSANSIAEVCNMQISDAPTPPSRRPQSARDLSRQLLSCKDASGWNSDAAERWWGRHDRKRSATRLPISVLDSFPSPTRRKNVTDDTSVDSASQSARTMDGTYDGLDFALDSERGTSGETLDNDERSSEDSDA